MRFDIVSVFPEFFSVLDLSLIGKARDRQLLDVRVHDLRSWTHDVHRTVDGAPCGGGAGMVMKPDVWASAIDDLLCDQTVIAIPSPAGQRLTQAACVDLAKKEHIIVACGRYEGIDARVADYYAQAGYQVWEYSLGDYVLNGGEVAAVALVEAVGRLVPGMVGNPDSLMEESHGDAGLLEYPNYTRPIEFRGHRVPSVLASGNHGAIARWRRDQALRRTVQRRPDMIAALDLQTLDREDRSVLAACGWAQPAQGSALEAIEMGAATSEDSEQLARLARETFPAACPPHVTPADIAEFCEQHLSERAFSQAIADPMSLIWGARHDGHLIGYVWAQLDCVPDPHVVERIPIPPEAYVVYLSKVYVAESWRGSGVAHAMIESIIDDIRYRVVGGDNDSPQHTSGGAEEQYRSIYLWLCTHVSNKRAQKAYRRAGFRRSGSRIFTVGEQINTDTAMARIVDMPQ
ncbi:tRNA (guanosine(37)-N1)-methyltransferase TrmD [Trueperella sp. LYQ143]|uniref:tRNA (guanosine(37)-N1)-methyltransferase TrmD n=1 Tax=Trueperella sp. LYQ143 TaxID=3391059 RepID=UPI003983502D